MLLQIFSLVFILCSAAVSESPPSRRRDYCVVGAGPSGLQLGSFLQQAGRDYVIFEKGTHAGEFFMKYPRHGKLISINKRYTGKLNDEFNMRHDWNSLVTDNVTLRMTRYSKEFFPPKDTLLRYLDDFARYYQLNIQYDTTISNITPLGEAAGTLIYDQHENSYLCKVLVMATGYSQENNVEFEGSELTESYGSVSVNPDDFEGKSVLIMGRGNSAFEVADNILGVTNLVHMASRSRVKLSWETHYVGDLRAINNGILDTYQLKSLDGLLEVSTDQLILQRTASGKVRVNISTGDMYDNFALREDYDSVITCLGFVYDFSVFNTSGEHPKCHSKYSKFPAIKPTYESEHVPGIYFAGTATHSLDFKKSAGGFIHGFRYTTQALHNLLEWKYERTRWPSITLGWLDVMNYVLKRINEASATYQMFGVLGDILLIDDVKQEVVALQEVPIRLLPQLDKRTGHSLVEKYGTGQRMIVMLFEYGKGFSGAGKDIFRPSRATAEPSEGHTSNFLHPVFYYYQSPPTEAEMVDTVYPDILPKPVRLHHIVEDFLTEFDGVTSHVLPLRRYMETVLGTDLRFRSTEDCFELSLTEAKLPVDCVRYLKGQGLSLSA